MVYDSSAKVYDLPATCFAIKSYTPWERCPFLVYDLTAIDTKEGEREIPGGQG